MPEWNGLGSQNPPRPCSQTARGAPIPSQRPTDGQAQLNHRSSIIIARSPPSVPHGGQSNQIEKQAKGRGGTPVYQPKK